MKHYNFLLVGAGLFNIVLARKLTNNGYKCLIIDKRSHIGGNCYTERKFNIDIHMYGPHIFHTSDKEIWDFANSYGEFESFQLNVKANYNGEIYSLPFNMNTFYELFKSYHPKHAYDIINKEIQEYLNTHSCYITNLEEYAISKVGKTIYDKLIKEYTEKQWNKPCSDLSPEIIKRLPIRLTYNNNYFNDKYQGLPKEGYTIWMMNMIYGLNEKSIKVELGKNFLHNKKYWMNIADKIIYCGEPDKLMDCQIGELEWRSLRFEHSIVKNDLLNDQGCPIMNYTSKTVDYTRSIDQKYLTPNYEKCDNKIMTYEFPQNYELNKTEAYYPINNDKNEELYQKYVELIKEKYPNIILGGRLGLYKYLDMDDTIYEANKLYEKIRMS